MRWARFLAHKDLSSNSMALEVVGTVQAVCFVCLDVCLGFEDTAIRIQSVDFRPEMDHSLESIVVGDNFHNASAIHKRRPVVHIASVVVVLNIQHLVANAQQDVENNFVGFDD